MGLKSHSSCFFSIISLENYIFLLYVGLYFGFNQAKKFDVVNCFDIGVIGSCILGVSFIWLVQRL